jgi:adenylate cyclase
MTEEAKGRARRRLAAVLVAGLRPLFPRDETRSFARLRSCLAEIIVPLISQFDGSIFKQTGDVVLSEFGSVVEAARCAAALREAMVWNNQNLPNEQRIAMRIGINLGDVIAESSDIFGDGVNIAARLEALAEPGSIFVSGTVHHHVADKVDFKFEDLGRKQLKNISRPVRIYRMGGEATPEGEDFAADQAAAVSLSGFDDRRAIAVLPFVNFGDDPEQEYFADGITEDIISMLATWRAFPVIARDSTFTFKGKAVDIKKVGEELGARYIVEGSVRKSGHRVRITAQLICADTGHHIMAEKFDRDLTDLFELQDEITRIIAGALEPELLKFERNRIADQPQRNEDAYEFYQRGMWHHYRHNKADNAEAQACFRCALATDPLYPQATAALAISVLNAGFLNWSDDAERNYEESFKLAEAAIRLDSRYPAAHWAFGAACMYTYRPDRAIAGMRQAIELNPSFAPAHATLGHLLAYDGRPEEAIPIVEKAIRLSPADPRLFITLPALACAHYQLRHYEQAIAIGRRSWTLNRNWPVGLRYVVAGLAQLGRIAEARVALAHLKEFDSNLSSVETLARRLFKDPSAVDHILDGLRKAGFE